MHSFFYTYIIYLNHHISLITIFSLSHFFDRTQHVLQLFLILILKIINIS
jgi:hypothetical protein